MFSEANRIMGGGETEVILSKDEIKEMRQSWKDNALPDERL